MAHDYDDNMVVVPAGRENFEDMFLKDFWSCIEISETRLKRLQYIACYQTAPVSAITHYARIKNIKRNSAQPNKYDIEFVEPAKSISPIKKGTGYIVRARFYTTLERLMKSKTVDDLVDTLR